jgi:hypothetical protein
MNPRGIPALVAAGAVVAVALLYGIPAPLTTPLAIFATLLAYVVSKEPTAKV